MSIHTQVALPTSLNDLLDARNNALRLIADARRTIELATQALAPYGKHLMPRTAKMSGDTADVLAELDTSMWRRAFDLTGFRQLMDAEAVKQFEDSLYPRPPEFTDATLRATFIDLRINAGSMFRRGIFNVFKTLSDRYRTNAKEPFRIGRKVVMSSMVEARYGPALSVKYDYAANKLNDLDRVIHTLDKKPFEARTLESAMNTAFLNGNVFENEYYLVKAFKNGNLHLEFKRPDLLEKVNDQIAEFYAEGALPDARAA